MPSNQLLAPEADHHQQALQALPQLVAPQVRLSRLQMLDAVLA
jgi:hypothetical protein